MRAARREDDKKATDSRSGSKVESPQSSTTKHSKRGDDINQTHDTPFVSSTDAIRGHGTMAVANAGVKHNPLDASAPDAPYPPPTRANDKYKHGGSSRGSSNTKRTSLNTNPPSTTKKNEASMAAAIAGITTFRRLVTPPIVAKAMHDTPSTLQGPSGNAASTSEKDRATKDPSKLECVDGISVDDQKDSRTLLAPAGKGKSGAASINGIDAKRDPQQIADEGAGIFSWTDAQLAQHYVFEKEIGFGNWGSVWLATPRKGKHAKHSAPQQQVAIKLVHRQGTPASNARVKAIWNETKILRSCGKPVHENLVNFKEFVITPSYALVVMDYYRQPMNVALPKSMYAGPDGYFHQLLDSINWLHERNVTHCDIKVANLLVDTRKDKLKGRPILVDFGFATLHDGKTKFMSNQSWGTPEYLSPERNRGDYHDERLSDVWALGVTFFEIATGRTPFEHEDEQFLTKEQLDVYYKRTLESEWVGAWTIPDELESLCRRMLAADAKKRIYCDKALVHPFFGEQPAPGNIGDIDESLMRELESGRRHSTPAPVSPRNAMPAHEVVHKGQDGSKLAQIEQQDTSDDAARASEDTVATDVSGNTLGKSSAEATAESAALRSSEEKANDGAATVDAGMARSIERSVDSQTSNMRQKTNNALQKLTSPFKRNKKRVAAYPPSAFPKDSKHHRAANNAKGFALHRASSEGSMAALKEHAGKRKNYSTQDTRLAKKLQNQSVTVKTEKSVQKEHATVDESVLQEKHRLSMTYTLDVDVTTSALDAYVPLDKEGFNEDVASSSFQTVVKDELNRESLAMVGKPVDAACSPTGSSNKVASPVDKQLPVIGSKERADATVDESPALAAEQSFRPSPPPKSVTAPKDTADESPRAQSPTLEQIRRYITQPALPEDVTADDLARRLADLSLLTNNLVQMVQETQMALRRLQDRPAGQAPEKIADRPTSAIATDAAPAAKGQAPSSLTVSGVPHQIEVRAQSPFRSMFRTSEVMARSALASPQPMTEAPKADLGVTSAVLVNQSNWQLSAFDRARQTPFAGMASSDIVQAPTVTARDYATCDLSTRRFSQAEHSIMQTADVTFAQYQSHDQGVSGAGLPLQSSHFFDDGSHEDLESSMEVRNLRSRQDASNTPSNAPVRKSSLRALRKSPSDMPQAESAPIAWPEQPPATAREVQSRSEVTRTQVLSRTYESNGRMDKNATSPTPAQAADRAVSPRAGERKTNLSKVKSMTLGRSNSVTGTTGRGANDSPNPGSASSSQKRNTLVETDKVFVIAASNNGLGRAQSQTPSQSQAAPHSTGGFVRTRLASLKGLGSRRPSFSRSGNASRDDVTLGGRTSVDVKYTSANGDGGSPPKTGHGATYARRGSNARRPPTPQPPLLGQRSPTKTEQTHGLASGSNGVTAGLGSPTAATPGNMHPSGTALWRILASKVQARR